MPNPSTYKYFAFISFQSADSREALRLQHAIESYRLPAVLCRHDKSIPRRVRPCFCYLNDIHAGEELMSELKSRMEQSRFLIVICSPRAVHSAYVNSGIDYFVSLGRRDSIIPLIIEGTPYSDDPSTECFPEALRRHFPKDSNPMKDHSILGINLNEQGLRLSRQTRRRAMLLVVSRMLRLDYDGLLLRDRERQRKRRIGVAALMVSIVTALTLTWYMSQAVDIPATLREKTPTNSHLPPLQDIVVTLQLDKEHKTDTFLTIGDTVVFRHIPPRYLGRKVQVMLRGRDIVPMDTQMVVTSPMVIPLERDARPYGEVRFRLRGVSYPESVRLTVAGQEVQADSQGRVALTLPLPDQRTAYEVVSRYGTDTLYMPCGEDDILLLE